MRTYRQLLGRCRERMRCALRFCPWSIKSLAVLFFFFFLQSFTYSGDLGLRLVRGDLVALVKANDEAGLLLDFLRHFGRCCVGFAGQSKQRLSEKLGVRTFLEGAEDQP